MSVNPYSSVSISGYNSAPPPDDGSQTSANRVEWAKHKTKLNDPIKTLSEGINTQALAAFAALSLTDVTVVTTTATVAQLVAPQITAIAAKHLGEESETARDIGAYFTELGRE